MAPAPTLNPRRLKLIRLIKRSPNTTNPSDSRQRAPARCRRFSLACVMQLLKRKVKLAYHWNGTLLTATAEIPTRKGTVRGSMSFDAGQVLADIHNWAHKRLQAGNAGPGLVAAKSMAGAILTGDDWTSARVLTGDYLTGDYLTGDYLTGDDVGDFLTGDICTNQAFQATGGQNGIQISDWDGDEKSESGGFFSGLSLKKLARKIAKAKILHKLVKAAKAIQSNPLLAKAVGLTTLFVPGLGAAVIAAKAATSIADGVMRQSPAAIQQVKTLKTLAKDGSKKAQNVLQLLKKTTEVRAKAGVYSRVPTKAVNLMPGASPAQVKAANMGNAIVRKQAQKGNPKAVAKMVKANGGQMAQAPTHRLPGETPAQHRARILGLRHQAALRLQAQRSGTPAFVPPSAAAGYAPGYGPSTITNAGLLPAAAAMAVPWMYSQLPNVDEAIRRNSGVESGSMSAQGSALTARAFTAPRVHRGMFSYAAA